MAENIIFKLLENLIPLLLVIIIMITIIYILIRKIFSPFSAMGNFLWERSTRFYDKIARTRKEKLETQLKDLQIENSEWKNKYVSNTNSILEIKDKLNDLSKIFTELNEIEIGNMVMDKDLGENTRQINELKTSAPPNVFSKIKKGIKIKKLYGKNAKIEKSINKIETNIDIKKEQIRTRIGELQEAVNNLSGGDNRQ
jgi:predicted  nucleic acid-binding Zn-ribbon protein